MEHRTVTARILALGGSPAVWLAALLVWTLVSAGRSLGTPWAAAAGTEAVRWGAGIGLALTLGLFLRRTEIAGQLLVTLTGVMALYGILGGETAAHSGLVGPYHDHQLYGSVLLLLLPFSAASALSAKSAPWRWGGLAAVTAGTLCLLLSQTRSAWIGLVVSAVVFGWLWLRRSASSPQPRRVVLLPAALLLAGLCLTWLWTGPASQQAAMAHRASTLAALSTDESWQSRLSLWHGAARMVTAHPLFGIGLGRYSGQQWLWTHTGDFLPPFARPSLSSEAHSFYGQTAAETGLIGLALYLAVLATFAAQGLRRLRQSRSSLEFSPSEALLLAALSALAGQGVDALASPSWQFPEVSLFFWVVLGLGLATLRQGAGQAVPAPLPTTLRRFSQWAMSGSLAVVLTAQVLPIGLLTPVEAYEHPAANMYLGAAVNQQTPCSYAASPCTFFLTAQYTNGPQDVTFDLDKSGIPASFTCRVYPNDNLCLSSFGKSGTALRNQLTVSASERGATLLITGSFEDGSVSNTGVTTYNGHASTALHITP